MEFWKKNTILFDTVPEGIKYQQDWKETKLDEKSFQTARYAIVWHHKSSKRQLDNLPKNEHLEYLELNWSNIEDLTNLDRFPNLKRLELHYCTKLQSLKGIENLANSLEFIHINSSKKLTDHFKVQALKRLKVLRFNNCGEIQDITFIRRLEQLQDFRIVGSNITDGNLEPIIEHPTIESVGMDNKRYYSHKEIQIEKHLKEKKNTSANV